MTTDNDDYMTISFVNRNKLRWYVSLVEEGLFLN